MNKKPIRLTESDLHTIVEDVVSSMMNGMGVNGQSQQQQGQQQNNQATAYQQALTKYLNQMNQNIVTQFGEINKKLDYIMNGGMSRYGNNGGFRGLNNQ